ncbi:hypothetical protein A2U01_0098169, partial [Trifolium medium]|nr:hypothetical protein [Trifolium medium]
GSDGAAETVVNGEGLGKKETFAAVVENGRRLGSIGDGFTVTEVAKPLKKKEWGVR